MSYPWFYVIKKNPKIDPTPLTLSMSDFTLMNQMMMKKQKSRHKQYFLCWKVKRRVDEIYTRI